ncbi:hypothetical protein UlMin_029520 [Ulmus minor]
MPLLKRTPFSLAEPPKDLEPHELVYQIRFTKEIFRDYDEYLNRINSYRQRVWTCKVTGKINLTYEEALVSEKHAIEKVQQLPKELVVPALCIIQYSMLSLRDLANAIAEKLQGRIFVGAELYARKDSCEYLCKVLKVHKEGDSVRYKVAWLDRNKKVIDTSTVNEEDLIQKKLPFSRDVLKSFIRESTYQSAPWVLHDKLAQKHGITTDLPEELRSKVSWQNGLFSCSKKKRKNENEKDLDGKRKKKTDVSTMESNALKEDDQQNEEPIKYPIDDLLVQPGADDPVFTDRPTPSRDSNVPMECVGDLLMVWDFCSSFGRLLHLSPYPLEYLENAICHKDGNTILVETHSVLLRLLIKDGGDYFHAVHKRNRKLKITLLKWTEYLCDFLEMIENPELRTHISTIKRGHYGLLDAHAKLGILCELVNWALETCIIRKKLEDLIEQRQALGATRREEALEEARKKREEKERSKAESNANGVLALEGVENESEHVSQNGDKAKKKNGRVIPPEQEKALGKSESKHSAAKSNKMAKKQNVDEKVVAENGDDDQKEETERRNKDQRKEYYEREMEKRLVCTNPLGKDRHYNRYWWFRRDWRIFVESADSKEWGFYSSKEELDALMGSLNCKGERERALSKQLEKFFSRISSELQKRTKDLTHKIELEDAVVRRSTRVRAPPREHPADAFLRYVNKWKED